MKFHPKFPVFASFILVGSLVSCTSSTNARKGKGAKGIRPSAETRFKTKDLNKDGYLSYQEFQTRPQSGASGKRTAPTAEMAKKRFAMLDTNSDQRISLAELKARPKKGSR